MFTYYRDQDVDFSSIAGSSSGIWIATIFLWLLPEQTKLQVGRKHLRGAENAKLCIELSETANYDNNAWIIKPWKAEQQLIPFVFECDTRGAENEDLRFWPIKLARNWVYQSRLARIEDANDRKIALSLVGGLAGAITCLLTERGRLHNAKNCSQVGICGCSEVSILNVMPDSWVSSYSQVLREYGWNDSIEAGRKEAYSILQEHFDSEADEEETPGQIRRAIQAVARDFAWERLGGHDMLKHSYIIAETSLYIAANAVSTATTNFLSGTRRRSAPRQIHEAFLNKIIGELVSTKGLDVFDYQRFAFTQAIPGLSDYDINNLIVSSDGYVAGSSVAWKLTTRQRDVLSITICLGEIRKDGFPYRCIREAQFVVAPFQNSLRTDTLREDILELKHNGIYSGLISLREQSPVSQRIMIAVEGTRLDLRTYYCRHLSDRVESRKSSWIRSATSLATAIHFNEGHEMTARQEQELAHRLHNSSLDVRWVSPVEDLSDYRLERIIRKTPSDERLRFFAAEFSCKLHGTERAIIVQHSAPLLACIAAAEKTRRPWLILSSGV